MPGSDLSRGNILYDEIVVLTLVPAPTAQGANSSAEQTFAVPGLTVGDHVDVQSDVAQTGGILVANTRVSAANTLAIQFANITGGSLSPVAGPYRLNVNRAFTQPANAL